MNLSIREIAGVSLWWAEGTKSRRDKRWKAAITYPVEVTNTDPEVMKVFLSFLRNDIGVDEGRLRVQVQIHEGDDQLLLEKYWSDVTQIPLTKFNKTIVRLVGNKQGKSRGTCKVRFSDKATHLKLASLWQDVASHILSD